MRIFRLRPYVAYAVILNAVACGSSGGGGSAPGTGASAAQTTCYDSAGNATSTCATTLSGTICPQGDANSCTPLVHASIYADDGKNGVCVELVFDNNCTTEIYADTCIAIAPYDGGPPDQSEQCWTSSVPVGGNIDVSQCHASGTYFSVATASSGQLDILEQKCPAPSI